MDGLIVLGIFGALGFVILSKLNEKRPKSVKKIYDLFKGEKEENMKDRIEQLHPQKRQIM